MPKLRRNEHVIKHYREIDRPPWRQYFYRIEHISRKRFKEEYRKAIPHRPREAEKIFERRVRVYEKKEYYRTTFIVNAKGSGRAGYKGNWTFTVDAQIYTTAHIGEQKRFEAMADLCFSLVEWIISDGGFHNPEIPHTVGGEVDELFPADQAERFGLWECRLAVEDTLVARGDYRHRRYIKVVNDCMLNQSQQGKLYSYVGLKVVARVAREVGLCGKEGLGGVDE